MTQRNRKNHAAFLCAALAIILAAVLRQIGFRVDGSLEWFCSILRSAIYIGLFAAWGVSVRRRIIQPQVRRYLTAISALMVFWVLARTIRYLFAEDPWLLRQLWYMYYLPMLFIPFLAVSVAMSLGKPEGFRLPKWTALLYLPAATLLLLVLTNDFHQLVFVFPADTPVWGNDYRYAFGYFMAVGWLVLCSLAALATMLVKCRIPSSRTFLMLPFIPIILALVYGVLYIFRVPWLKSVAGDMTVVFCLLFTAALESCIQCGLIQSNTRYAELFNLSTVAVQITDNEYNVFLSSEAARSAPKELLRQTADGPVILDNGIRFSGAPIHGGHVVWQDDVSEIHRLLKEQRSVNEQLEEENDLLIAENQLREEKARVDTKNRLYDRITKEVEPQLVRLDALLREDGGDLKRRLGEICVLGAFIKRRSNLILLSENKPSISAAELSYCLSESVNNLEASGTACSLRSDCKGTMHIKTALVTYDFFEAVLELALPTLHSALIHLTAANGAVTLGMMLDCEVRPAAISALPQYRQIVEQSGQCGLTENEGEIQLSVTLPKGGGTP